ncbi:MAG: lysophospholipid acyltransferase family protein [Bryobacteraceae bacterium]
MMIERRDRTKQDAKASTSLSPPHISTWQLRLFAHYCRRYLSRHFHRLYLLEQSPLSELGDRPILICLNHPSWWDPILAVFLSQRLFATRRHYGPIAAAGMSKYKFFEKLGFFAIDTQRREGAFRFLQIGRSVLTTPNGTLWVTAQGQFEDARVRPTTFQPGVGYLARFSSGCIMLPLAIEYSFWRERTPEAFACFGEPIEIRDGRAKAAAEWTRNFALSVERTQDHLAQRVKTGQESHFEELLSGAAGVGGVYDLWRGMKSYARGKRFRAEHGLGSR